MRRISTLALAAGLAALAWRGSECFAQATLPSQKTPMSLMVKFRDSILFGDRGELLDCIAGTPDAVEYYVASFELTRATLALHRALREEFGPGAWAQWARAPSRPAITLTLPAMLDDTWLDRIRIGMVDGRPAAMAPEASYPLVRKGPYWALDVTDLVPPRSTIWDDLPLFPEIVNRVIRPTTEEASRPGVTIPELKQHMADRYARLRSELGH